jgi:hypothetical protein
VLVLLESASHAAGTACAIGRAFPLFSAKTSRGRDTGGVPQTVCVSFATRAGPVANDGTLAGCAAAAAAVRRAARLSDAGRSSHVPVIGSKASMLSARRLDRQRERLAARGGGMVF